MCNFLLIMTIMILGYQFHRNLLTKLDHDGRDLKKTNKMTE